jgi:hypothetical protein
MTENEKLIADLIANWRDSRAVLLDRDVPKMKVAAMIRDGDRLADALAALARELEKLSEEPELPPNPSFDEEDDEDPEPINTEAVNQ